MNLAAIHSMKAKTFIARKCLGLAIETFTQHCRQFSGRLVSDVAHDDEHSILHRRIIDGAPIPNTTMYKNVEVCRHYANFS
jgi:hypothetical protein